MNKNLKSFYVAISEGKVVLFDTNLSAFVEKLKKEEPGEMRSLSTFQRIFKQKDFNAYANESGKVYLLQKLTVRES